MRATILAAAIAAVFASTFASAGEITPVHSIAVAGSAEILVPAEFAVVTLGVVSQGATVAEASAENNTRMARVVATLKTLGIAERDIKTTRFDIAPRYAPRRQGDVYDSDDFRPIVGYAVSNTVEVTLRDMTKTSDVIDRSLAAGANSAGDVDFGVSNVAELFDRARRAACANALHRAQVLAAATNLELGRAISVTDNQASRTYDNRPRGYSVLETVTVTGSRIPTPIMPGQVRLVSTVTVLYAVK